MHRYLEVCKPSLSKPDLSDDTGTIASRFLGMLLALRAQKDDFATFVDASCRFGMSHTHHHHEGALHIATEEPSVRALIFASAAHS